MFSVRYNRTVCHLVVPGRWVYDMTITRTDIGKAKKMFAKKNNELLVPSTKAALEEHCQEGRLRGTQGGHMSGQAMLPAPCSAPRTNQMGMASKLVIVVTAACTELVSCKCKRCRKAALQ